MPIKEQSKTSHVETLKSHWQKFPPPSQRPNRDVDMYTGIRLDVFQKIKGCESGNITIQQTVMSLA